MINDDKISSLERLHKLKTDGVITEADFEKAKNDLLSGPVQSVGSAREVQTHQPATSWEEGLPADNDYVAWALLPIRRYAQFDGRSSRKEFWMFQAGIALVSAAAFILMALGRPEYSFQDSTFSTSIVGLWVVGMLGLFIPMLAVQVRRFHDQDKSGWFALFNIIPYLGVVIVLIFMAIDGTPGENRYGPDPKQRL